MKFFCSSLFVWLFCGAIAQSSIVTISTSEEGRYFTDSTGYRLADGSLAWIGTFGDESAIEGGMSIEALQQDALWQWFGNTSTISIGSESGRLGDDVSNTSQDALSFGGKTIYIWIFNRPTVSGVTEYGIFTVRGGDAPWVFAANGIGSSTTISLENPALIALVGSVDGNRLSLTQIIPEPAVYAALLGGAGLALVALRRRQKRVR